MSVSIEIHLVDNSSRNQSGRRTFNRSEFYLHTTATDLFIPLPIETAQDVGVHPAEFHTAPPGAGISNQRGFLLMRRMCDLRFLKWGADMEINFACTCLFVVPSGLSHFSFLPLEITWMVLLHLHNAQTLTNDWTTLFIFLVSQLIGRVDGTRK